MLLALLTGCDDDAAAPPGPDVDVVGRWVPEEAYVEDRSRVFDVRDAVIRFDADGTWAAHTDSCKENDLDGTYRVDGDKWSADIPYFVGGVGCSWGHVPYERLIPGTTLRIERTGDVLTYFDNDDPVLQLRAYSGKPRPYSDVDGRQFIGNWHATAVFGHRVTYDGPYGRISVGQKGLGIIRGCRWVHGILDLGPGGGFTPQLKDEPTGCPVWTLTEDLGPNTPRVLQHAVRMQIHGDRLTFYAPGHRLIGVYVRDRDEITG